MHSFFPSLFKSATLQYCGQPNRLRSCGLKKVAELLLQTFKIWPPQFSNSPQSPANSATFWYLFFSPGWLYKSTKNIFRTVCFSGHQKLVLNGQLLEIFFPPIFFFTNRQDSTAKNMPIIAEMKLSSCGLKVRTSEKIATAELQLRSNISLKRCGIVIAKVLPPSCGISIADSKKKLLRVPTADRL